MHYLHNNLRLKISNTVLEYKNTTVKSKPNLWQGKGEKLPFTSFTASPDSY